MRSIAIFAAAVIAGGAGVGLAAGGATAGPNQKIAYPQSAIPAVEKVALWRRQYRRQNRVPPIADNAPVTTVVPLVQRPRSCGEYHFWDGFRCVDARYVEPDTGPKG